MENVYYSPDSLIQKNLMLFSENIKSGRTDEDLLFQVLLDWGIDISLSIEKRQIYGKNVFFVDNDSLVACFEKEISEEIIHDLARHKPLRIVFRDNGFKSDSVKINTTQIFSQISPATEVKTI
jgi:adenine-specific DNA-methyltransferase